MKNMKKRIIMAACGVFLTSIGIGILNVANLGTDPFSCLILGLCRLTGLSYGTVFPVLTFVLLAGVLIADRHYIGISTIFNLLFTGIIADLSMNFLKNLFPDPAMPVRVGLLMIALLLICFAASLYYTADLGVSAYDAWALILSDKGLAQFRLCRIGTDAICTILGLFMGLVPGVGTLLAAFCMGPLIEAFKQYFSVPLLDGKLLRRNQNKIKFS